MLCVVLLVVLSAFVQRGESSHCDDINCSDFDDFNISPHSPPYQQCRFKVVDYTDRKGFVLNKFSEAGDVENDPESCTASATLTETPTSTTGYALPSAYTQCCMNDAIQFCYFKAVVHMNCAAGEKDSIWKVVVTYRNNAPATANPLGPDHKRVTIGFYPPHDTETRGYVECKTNFDSDKKWLYDSNPVNTLYQCGDADLIVSIQRYVRGIGANAVTVLRSQRYKCRSQTVSMFKENDTGYYKYTINAKVDYRLAKAPAYDMIYGTLTAPVIALSEQGLCGSMVDSVTYGP